MLQANLPYSLVLIDSGQGTPTDLQQALTDQQSKVRLSILSDKQQALAQLSPASDSLFRQRQVILFDLEPGQTTDWDLLRRLVTSKEHLSSPIIVLSNSTETETIRKAYQEGAASFLARPQSEQDWQALFCSLTRYWFETVTLP
ncbi:hypothetical protein GCM10023189_59650 [Nibrella saemangeumensis]|uniref:Response regulatory domain-containing protein n=1 Tax=Nibrella saemangeumensis TaxID=1084526 RepID=A0ABP8NPJ7_9BACT